jgi:hypothetical protein
MNTIKDIRLLENRIRRMVSETKAGDIKQEIQAAYDAVKEVKKKLKELGKSNKETNVLKAAARKMVDELEDLEDMDMDEEMTETEHETISRNEQSEGYGTFKGLGMSENKVIELSENDLNTLLRNVVSKKKDKLKENLLRDVKKTYNLIRSRVIVEGINNLRIPNYTQLINEQSEWSGGRNPGSSAADGIENILDNLNKAWNMIKDSTTKKQISNTLTKLNNFATYTAELIGSGAPGGSSPRSYEELSEPLPYPELDEPEDLEDIDDEISM